MFEEIILTNSFEIHCVEDLLLYHLSVYYYFISEGRINKDMLTPLNKKFNNILNRYVESISDESSKNLISDTIETIKLRGGLINPANLDSHKENTNNKRHHFIRQ